MAARTAAAPKTAQKIQRELEDLQLVMKARNGSHEALDGLIRRYTGFVRLKASSYFLAGGDSDDLIQEGMIGLYKAVRDFRPDKETSFRSFAELCVTRQIITAIKTASRIPPAGEEFHVHPEAALQALMTERHHRIQVAAYYLAERSGFAPGHELDDWLAAEDAIDMEDAGRAAED